MGGRFGALASSAALCAVIFGMVWVSPAIAANPSVSVSPSQAPHGGTIQVSGTGFIPKTTVLIYINNSDNWKKVVSTRADGNGAITDPTGKGNSYSLKIDCDMPTGDYTLSAASYTADSASLNVAKTSFTVTSDKPVGVCAKTGPAPPPPTAVATQSPGTKNLWKLGFNLTLKPKTAAYGQTVAVKIDTHWPSVFKGTLSVVYDKKHHTNAKVQTSKKGVLTYHFKVTFHVTKTKKSQVKVTLSGTVLGQKMKGVQSAAITIKPH